MELLSLVVQVLSGLLLTMVGFFRLIKPIDTYLKSSGITIASDVDLLSEVRGISSVMLCSGIIILLGLFLHQIRLYSLVIAILIFMSFAIGRVVSIVCDGKPNKQIVKGLVFELVFGTLNILVLIFLMSQ